MSRRLIKASVSGNGDYIAFKMADLAESTGEVQDCIFVGGSNLDDNYLEERAEKELANSDADADEDEVKVGAKRPRPADGQF